MVFAGSLPQHLAPRRIPCMYTRHNLSAIVLCRHRAPGMRIYTDHHLEWCRRRRACIHSPLQTYVFRRARDEYAFVPPLRNALQQWRHHRAHRSVCAYVLIYTSMILLYIIIHFSDRRRH